MSKTIKRKTKPPPAQVAQILESCFFSKCFNFSSPLWICNFLVIFLDSSDISTFVDEEEEEEEEKDEEEEEVEEEEEEEEED
eukprot:CAMPEP_0201501626 /NCGR_PEP_ID=MMETSP0151_2-20130828/83687_1 /ASSEMBLY_ACC=CAM_ASM_000257 /TAXON_ID=200890 /ORGANISM="Paramoeba atlantica, Strain 621/1 / CCAP 1560/9" /LENGTH=81 /DNA_ID=CAMNT_0047895145 /DNA_START=1834 /DNA_END=2077 /DNA_ORIENTATION=-